MQIFNQRLNKTISLREFYTNYHIGKVNELLEPEFRQPFINEIAAVARAKYGI